MNDLQETMDRLGGTRYADDHDWPRAVYAVIEQLVREVKTLQAEIANLREER